MFENLATKVAHATGTAYAFSAALLLVLVWVPSIFFIRDIDTWQLVINTTTTIITFLLLFIVQHTQNRDTIEIKAMLRELLEAVQDARPAEIVIEEAEDNED